MSALRGHEQSFEIDSFLVPGSVWKWRGRAYRCCYAFGAGAARLFGRLGQNLGCSQAPACRESSRGRVKERRGRQRAAHRSGAALIAIADSVAAPMVEGADHNGAMSTPHARASPGRRSRQCGGCLPSSKRGVSIFQLWCTLNVCMSIVDLH